MTGEALARAKVAAFLKQESFRNPVVHKLGPRHHLAGSPTSIRSLEATYLKDYHDVRYLYLVIEVDDNEEVLRGDDPKSFMARKELEMTKLQSHGRRQAWVSELESLKKEFGYILAE